MSLKVLILMHSFSSKTETFIYHDALALQQFAQVKVVCFNRQNESTRPFTPLEVIPYQKSWIRKKWNNQLYKLNFSLNFSFTPLKKELDSVLIHFTPDVIHLHFGIQALHFIDNIEFTGPIFITFHGYDATKIVKKSTIYRKRLQALFCQKNIFPLATSASLFMYMKKYGIKSSRSQVLYSGVKIDLFQRKPKSRKLDTVVFTQVSSFQPKKGHYFLLQAFCQLLLKHPEKNLMLILAGGGPLENKMKDLVIQLKIEHAVKFLGWVTQVEAVNILNESDVFVHPSITLEDENMESTTVAILEAMAMELPVFATWHSGIPEIMEHGKNGLLAKERDIDEYVNCLEELMYWGPQPQNRQKIIDHFSHRMHMQKLLEIYKQAIQACTTLK